MSKDLNYNYQVMIIVIVIIVSNFAIISLDITISYNYLKPYYVNCSGYF